MQRKPAEGAVATPSSIELAMLTLTITWVNCLAIVEGAAEEMVSGICYIYTYKALQGLA